MTTYVLVHGGWHGGWCWRKVATLLRAKGHEVFTPTMTGLGDRVHLAGPEVGLETHVQGIINVLFFEDLSDVVLVGHSYGGVVVTGSRTGFPSASSVWSTWTPSSLRTGNRSSTSSRELVSSAQTSTLRMSPCYRATSA